MLIGGAGRLCRFALQRNFAVGQTFRETLRAELIAEDERDLVELLLNDLEDGAQDWLWETDSRGIASTVSYRFAEQVGLPAAQIRGRTMHEILIGIGASRTDVGRKSLDLLAANFQAGTAFRDLTMQVVVRGGDTRWWSMSGHPAVAMGGRPTGGAVSDPISRTRITSARTSCDWQRSIR